MSVDENARLWSSAIAEAATRKTGKNWMTFNLWTSRCAMMRYSIADLRQ